MTGAPYAGIAARAIPGAQLKAVVPLTGGVSADVDRLDLTLPDGGEAQLVLRVHGGSHSGHAAELEYELLQSLHRQGVPVPEPLLVDASRRVLEHPFLVMSFIPGTSAIPRGLEGLYIQRMADALAQIHALPTDDLPALPMRIDPLPELLDYLPDGARWANLRSHLAGLDDTGYRGSPKLLHGDFWPQNLLWHDGIVMAILDWEDAALGDPLSDIACTRLELRYKFGKPGMNRFTQAYAKHRVLDRDRLALWQVYVAAAAHEFMGQWRLAPELESHMRKQALSTIREAGAAVMSSNRS